MPKLNMTIAHNLSEDEAVRRIKSGLDDMKRRFADKISDMHENWKGNTCEFGLQVSGFSGSGTMNVKTSEIEITSNLPFAAFFFKDKIESAIREKLKQLFA